MTIGPRYPRSAAELKDLAIASREFVLPGYVPAEPPFKRTDYIWTLGSCFALNLHKALSEAGIPSGNLGLQENVNAPPYLRKALQDVIGAGTTAPARVAVQHARCALLTCGIAAALFDRDGKPLYDSAVVEGQWRALSVPDCERDIAASVDAIHAVNPGAHIVLTVSPVPLNRAMWHTSPVAADCLSKSTLRVAIEQVVRERHDRVSYWPSFEIARWLGAHRSDHYAADDGMHRHVSRSVVDTIIRLFVESYFEPPAGASR